MTQPGHRQPTLDPTEPYQVLIEHERDQHGTLANVTTIFLTASRCPIGCSMCQLHQFTLPHPTPDGAITEQIEKALAKFPADESLAPQWIKLYNSGNFFDPTSIPPSEFEAIAALCQPFDRVIVENHPRFGTQRLQTFRKLLSGRLEIAVGLETVQPRWLRRMNKQMTRDQFDQYARYLKSLDVDLRVFLIVGVPGITVAESLRWARLSIRHAVRQSARHVSLIAARADEDWRDEAATLPVITHHHLQQLQQSASAETAGRCVITVDLWTESVIP